MLRTHRAGKGPGRCGGWGLGSTEQKGPRVPPACGLRGRGTPPGNAAGFLGSSWGQGPNALHSSSCSSGLGGPLPLDLLVLSYALLPPMPPRPTWPRGDLWGHRTQPKSQAHSPGWLGRGNAGHAPPRSVPLRVPPGVGTPPPFQPPFRGAGPVRPPLFLPLQYPYVLPVHLGFHPVSLGVRIPHQHPAGALVVGRRELCVFPHHHLDSAASILFFDIGKS